MNNFSNNKGKKSSGFIDKYLERFSESLKGAVFQKDEIVQVIKSVIKIEVDKEKIEIKDGVLFLKVSPIIRSEIVMKKEKLLAELSKLKIFDIK